MVCRTLRLVVPVSVMALLLLALFALPLTVWAAVSLINGDFESGDFTGWTTFTTPNGTIGTPAVVMFDTDGDGTASNSARFNVGQVSYNADIWEGGGIYQVVNLNAGTLNITADIAAQNSSGGYSFKGGRFSLLLDGSAVANHSFGVQVDDTVLRYTLSATVPAVTAGSHEIRILIERPFLQAGGLFQYVDNVAISGSATEEPELSLVKTDHPDPVYAGQELFYEITLTNPGPGTNWGPIVSDTLPAEVIYLADTAGCDTTNLPELLCSLPDIAAGASRSFQIKTQVPASLVVSKASGTLAITNQAEIVEPALDPLPPAYRVTEGTFVEDLADLVVTKAGVPDKEVRAGQNLVYTIYVDNNGPSDARGVVAIDNILSTMAVGLVTDPPTWNKDDPVGSGNCSAPSGSSGPISCTIGILATGGRAEINITVVSSQTQDVNNLVRVTADTADPDMANNEAMVMTAVTDVADLAITKTFSPTTVLAGEPLRFELEVTNNGPSTAENVVVKDFLPAGVTVTDVVPAQGSCTTGTPGDPFAPLVCNLGTMTPTASVHIDLFVDVHAGYPVDPVTNAGLLENDAEVSSDIFDPDNGDNRAFTLTTVEAEADLELIKVPLGPFPWIAGEVRTYEYLIENHGPSVARSVKLREFLPDELEFVRAYTTLAGQAGGVPLPCEPVSNNGFFCPLGDVPVTGPGSWDAAVYVDVFIKSDVPEGTPIINNADLYSETPDPDGATASATVEVLTEADVWVEKESEPEVVYAGEQKKYTITVGNHGPSDAVDVVVSDTLPIEVDYEIDTADCALVAEDPDGLECALGTLKPGEERQFVIWARVAPETPPDTVLLNQVRVPREPPSVGPRELFAETFEAGVGSFTLDNDGTGAEWHPRDNCPSSTAGGHSAPGTLRWGNVEDCLNYLSPTGTSDVARTPTIDTSMCAGNLTLSFNYFLDYQESGIWDRAFAEVLVHWGPGFTFRVAANQGAPGGTGPVTLQNGETWHNDATVDLDALLSAPPYPPGLEVLFTGETGDAVASAGEGFVIDDVVVSCDALVGGDPDLTNNEDTAENLALGKADLWIRKFGKPDGQVRAGEELTYHLNVTNLGPSATQPGHVVLNELLASDGTFMVTEVFSERDMTCTTEPSPGIGVWVDGRWEAECTLNELLGVYEEWELTITVTADETQDLNNQADVEFTGGIDPNPDNNHAEVEHDITDVSDLSVVKEGPEVACIDGAECAPTAGWPVTYRLVVHNDGPSTAENVVVQDMLPAGVQLIEVRPGQGSCTAGEPGEPGAPLTCGLGELAPGAGATVEIEVMIDAGLSLDFFTIYLGELCDSAWVMSDVFDPNSGNDRSHLCHPVIGVANLAIVSLDAAGGVTAMAKPEAPGSVLVGETLTYLVVVVNGGPTEARDVRLFDILPAGTTYHSDTLPGLGSCEISPIEYNFDGYPVIPAGALRCDLGDLGPGEVEEFSISVVVDSDVPDSTVLENTVVAVSMEVLDPVPADNVGTVETLALTQADVEVSKAGQPAKVYAGEQILYTIEVVNHGPADAQNVTVADTLPAGVWYEIDSAGCELLSEDPDVLSCNVGTLRPGESRTIEVWGYVNFRTAQRAVLANEACVTSETTLGDPNPDNDCAAAENLVLRKADLKIRKFGKPDGEVRAGENLTYTLVVDNLGPGYAHAVHIWDLLQSSGTFALVSVTSDRPATCTPEDGTFRERLALNCGLLGDLPVRSSDESGRWLLTVVVRADATQDINNLAEVVSAAQDPDHSNNSAYAEHDITDVADLNTSKCVWPDATRPEHDCGDGPVEVVAGTEVKYRATITNDGPSAAENVVLVDRLPRGMEVVAIEHGGFDCALTQPSVGDTVLECGYPNLEPGEQKYVDYVVRVDPGVPHGAVLANGATSWSSIYDPDAFNDYDELLVRVHVENALGIRKEDTPDPALAGGLLEYTLVAGNDGPSTAWDAFVWDGLPAEVEFVSVQATNWAGALCSYSAGYHEVMCYLGEMQPGATVKVQIETRVKPDTAPGRTLHNAAEIWSRHGSASAGAGTGVYARADLAIGKRGAPAIVTAGDRVQYTLEVTNHGPSDARQVVVTDELPAGMAYEIDTADCTLASLGPDVVICELGTLGAGGSFEFGLWARVDATAGDGGQLVNQACVAGAAGGDANPGNDCSTARCLVEGRSDLALSKTAVGGVMGPGGVVTEVADRVTAGQNLVYTLRVDNFGTSAVENVVVEDRLPAGILVTEINTGQGRCSWGTPGDPSAPMTCNLGGVAAGASVTIVIQASVQPSVPGGTLLQNEARVSGDLPDLTNANDLDINATTVSAWADLSATKWQSPAMVEAGEAVGYSIRVRNAGPSDAPWSVVSDTMPVQLGGVTWECMPFGGASCPASGTGDIYHSVDLPAGGQVVYRVAAVRETDGQDLVNTAQVLPDAGVDDPDMENNTARSTNAPYKQYMPLVVRSQ